MKSVIVEIRGSYAAALSDDGCVTRIRNKNFAVGQVIDFNHNLLISPPTKAIIKWASSAAAVLILCGVSGLAYFTPYSYVSLDVNPSIEYTLNRFDRVLSAIAVNADGESILMDTTLENLNNKTIDDAIALTLDEISKQGYFDGQESGIVIATSAKDLKKASKLADELEQTVVAETAENGDEVEVESVSVAVARVTEAKVLGVTPGRLHLVEKLQESAADPDDIDVQEWLGKSVKDIMKATRDNRKSMIVGSSQSNSEAATANEGDDDTDNVDNGKNGGLNPTSNQQENGANPEIRQQSKAEEKEETRTENKTMNNGEAQSIKENHKEQTKAKNKNKTKRGYSDKTDDSDDFNETEQSTTSDSSYKGTASDSNKENGYSGNTQAGGKSGK